MRKAAEEKKGSEDREVREKRREKKVERRK
jgi:hypothetical protein